MSFFEEYIMHLSRLIVSSKIAMFKKFDRFMHIYLFNSLDEIATLSVISVSLYRTIKCISATPVYYRMITKIAAAVSSRCDCRAGRIKAECTAGRPRNAGRPVII